MDFVRIEMDIEDILREMDIVIKRDVENTFVRVVLERGAILL